MKTEQRTKKTEQRMQRIHDVVSARQQGVLVLEDVFDPVNTKATFRTAEALGFQHICLVFQHEQPYDPSKSLHQTYASAYRWLSFSVFRSIEACADSLKRDGYELVATVADPEAESIYEAELLNPRIALLLGNERDGLSRAAIERADRRLTVPIAGMVQSINVGVAAAICLFEITRQRRRNGGDFALPPDERERLSRDFISR